MSIISIRNARPEDATWVAPLICEAMDGLVDKFTNGNIKEGISLFEYFFREKENQYSYENCRIAQYDGQDAGMILTYDGQLLTKLRQPFLDYLKEHFQTDILDIEEETQKGELYIDCLTVLPAFRGKSIGSALVEDAISTSQQKNLPAAGLLVDLENEKALRLYQRMGFIHKNIRSFFGGNYSHMQYDNP